VLRRKLDALAYAEPVEAGSAALVERLVADLVATTESWRGIKLRDAARGQQLAEFQAQVRPIKRMLWHKRHSAARRSPTHYPLLFSIPLYTDQATRSCLRSGPLCRSAVRKCCCAAIYLYQLLVLLVCRRTSVLLQVPQRNKGPLAGEKVSHQANLLCCPLSHSCVLQLDGDTDMCSAGCSAGGASARRGAPGERERSAACAADS